MNIPDLENLKETIYLKLGDNVMKIEPTPEGGIKMTVPKKGLAPFYVFFYACYNARASIPEALYDQTLPLEN